jgi:hypothetical protein
MPDKALNLAGRVKESSVLSICREFSAGADDLDAYGEAFGITLVSRRAKFGEAVARTSWWVVPLSARCATRPGDDGADLKDASS